jgi:hypothetical protein
MSSGAIFISLSVAAIFRGSNVIAISLLCIYLLACSVRLCTSQKSNRENYDHDDNGPL